MTLSALKLLIDNTKWFEHLGQPGIDEEFARLFTLQAWTDMPASDEGEKQIADLMTWLPSSKDQDDPIHGRSMEDEAERLGRKIEISHQSLAIYKFTLTSLRTFQGHPALKITPHDFTEAARGSVLYAVRRATYEILLDKPGFWCRLMRVYHSGHWPCGILPSGRVVVI